MALVAIRPRRGQLAPRLEAACAEALGAGHTRREVMLAVAGRFAAARGLSLPLPAPDLGDRLELDTAVDYAALPLETLGGLYERLLELEPDGAGGLTRRPASRQASGSFYTPRWLVDDVVRHTLEAPATAWPTVCDPAMGTGHFLVGAADELAVRLAVDRRQVIERCLFGVDLDPLAVELARMTLWLHAGGCDWAALGRNLRCGNALVGSVRAAPADAGGLCWEDAYPDVIRRGGFDAVIGNPPWIHVKRGGLGRDLPAIRAWATTAVGQYDAAGLFVERALQLSRDRIGLVVPKPVALSESYEPVRALLLERGLERVAIAGDCFGAPAVEAAVIIAGRRAGAVRVERLDRSGPERLLPTELIRRMPFQIVSPALSEPVAARIVDGLESGRLCRLGRLVRWTRGVEAGKGITSPLPHGARTTRIIAGEQVEPFEVGPPRYFDRDALAASAAKPRALYERPAKLLVRRVATGPIAAVDGSRAHVLNTLYVADVEDATALWALCGYLNAAPTRELWQAIFATDDAIFPYLRVSQLDAFVAPAEILGDGRLATLARAVASGRREAMAALDARVRRLLG